MVFRRILLRMMRVGRGMLDHRGAIYIPWRGARERDSRPSGEVLFKLRDTILGRGAFCGIGVGLGVCQNSKHILGVLGEYR